MRWQDIVISIVQIGFVIAMIPSITSKNKPALATCVMNVVFVCIVTFCLLTLELWLSAVTAAAVAFTWGILAVQKINDKSHKRKS